MPIERAQAQGCDGNIAICHILLKKAILLHKWPKVSYSFSLILAKTESYLISRPSHLRMEKVVYQTIKINSNRKLGGIYKNSNVFLYMVSQTLYLLSELFNFYYKTECNAVSLLAKYPVL